jgi:hypothetical protein
MKNTTLIGGSGLFGLCLGLVLTGQGIKSHNLAIGALIGLPIAGISLIVADTKSQQRINQAEAKANNAVKELELAIGKVTQEEIQEARLKVELAESKETLAKLKDLLKACESERCESFATIASLNQKVNQLVETLNERTNHLNSLEAEIQELEESFDERLELESEVKFQASKKAAIKRIEDEHDSMTLEALELAKSFQQLTADMDKRMVEKTDEALDLANQYNGLIDGVKNAVSKEVEEYLKQIEILNVKVAILQQQLAGDLIQPEYGQFGYAVEGKISNDIARRVWEDLQIPLAVKGYHVKQDGSVDVGYGYSRSIPVEALTSDLNRHSDNIVTWLGIHKIVSIKKHEISDLLIVTFQRERPKVSKEDDIYRILESAHTCTETLRQAMNHRKGGKPTLRIMGATGEGKGIIAKVLLADWVKTEPGEVWLSDPMDGSDEDRWEVAKAAKGTWQGRELLKTFVAEFNNRKGKISSHSDIQVLALFDEFDKEHPRDDKDTVKGIWTAIRHHNMKLILMGQSSEVGSNGWQWDEMKNCSCLFVGSGITTAIKHAKDLGLSRQTANTLEQQNDLIVNWLESKNQGLDAANQYRVGLLVTGDKAKFIEFPAAHKGTIKNDLSSIVSRPWETQTSNTMATTIESKICPGCGAKLRKQGNLLRCGNKEHTKEMGVKSFKLDSNF